MTDLDHGAAFAPVDCVSAIEPSPIVRMLALVFPNRCNHHGTLFGGEAMALMDKAAFLAASRHGRDSFVTARSTQIDFTAPIHEGELVEAEAHIIRVGVRSLDVQVTLWGESLLTGERRQATTGTFTLVANKRDKTNPLPQQSDTGQSGILDLGNDLALAPALQFQDLVFPPQTNHYGTLFGGDALAMMGRAATVLASRKAQTRVVMAACDHSRFVKPVHEGEMVDIRAEIERHGRASIHIHVELWAENLLTGAQRQAGSARYVMVAVDAHGDPLQIWP